MSIPSWTHDQNNKLGPGNDTSPARKRSDRPKRDESARHMRIAFEAEGWGEMLVDERLLVPQRSRKAAAPSSPSSVNMKKRAATPENQSSTDIRRSESPLKVARTSGKLAVGAIQLRSLLRNNSGFLALTGVALDSLADRHLVEIYGEPEFLEAEARGDAPRHVRRELSSAVKPASDTHLKASLQELSEPNSTLEPRLASGTSVNVTATALAVLRKKARCQTEEGDQALSPHTSLPKQPDARPVTLQQLTAEVKAIFAGLILVEAKCMKAIDAQNIPTLTRRSPRLDAACWKAMISLHRNLLHEHHDFLLASQHPYASSSLKSLALKHSLPARMWKHGIHNFLELLRRNLPDSLDFMLMFIYLAYQIIALLYETVTSFEETWIECLGDLSRYRMAIEDDNQSDREIWTCVARSWYSKAAYKGPTVGRLYHHLAILARSQAVQQLSLYCRSLTAVQMFPSARDSIMTLFEPILRRSTSTGSRPLSVESWFVRVHGLIFTNASPEMADSAIQSYLSRLGDHINRMKERWKLQGAYMAIANVASLLEYGLANSPLRAILDTQREVQAVTQSSLVIPTPVSWRSDDPCVIDSHAWQLTVNAIPVVLNCPRTEDILPYIHIVLAFFFHLSHVPGAISFLDTGNFWYDISVFLNVLIQPLAPHNAALLQSSSSLPSYGAIFRPLPEDYLLRGLIWARGYFPDEWLQGVSTEEEDHMEELDTTPPDRIARVLWLGFQLASLDRWLFYDSNTKMFSAEKTTRTATQELLAKGMPLSSQMSEQMRLPIHPPRLTKQSTLSTMAGSNAKDELYES